MGEAFIGRSYGQNNLLRKQPPVDKSGKKTADERLL
jgi:hypothetical protein